MGRKRRVRADGDLSPQEEARRVNAEPWEPMPGMVKVRCTNCGFLFAARSDTAGTCPDCLELLRRIMS